MKVNAKFPLLALLLLVMSWSSGAQNPKTEIRAVWVATVSNLDWPSGSNKYDTEIQKGKMLELLDSVVSWNLNTVFLQIRPQSDAFYPSNLAPWSEYASGVRGTSPGYDPLLFAINEAHKRGIELHGWLNPYRYESFKGKNDGKPGDYNADHPEWMLNYADDRIFNPGVPEVRQHLKEIVGEIVNNYDIDGIHFDDYFYPYSGTSTQDQATFDSYGTGFTDIGDWRRNNVTQMIADVYDTIQSVSDHVRFGISPFGIYGNGQNPSGISGLDAYNTIYMDPLEWLSQGTVDYLCPQLYWPTGGAQDFATLLPWWAGHAKAGDRHVMAGHGIYRLDNNPNARIDNSLHESKAYFDQYSSSGRVQADAWTLSQVSLQIDITRENVSDNAVGGAFFRYQDFIRVNGLVDHLKESTYQYQALLPAMTWKNAPTPVAPLNVRWEEDANGVFFITWDAATASDRYVLYASELESPAEGFFDDPANMVSILYDNVYYLSSSEGESTRPYLFFSTYDRYGNESAETTLFSIQAPATASILQLPMNDAVSQSSSFDFAWSSAVNAQSYKLQIATDADFTSISFEEEISATSVNAAQFALLGGQQYYWKITPVNFFGEGPESSVFNFSTGFPANPVITNPINDQELVDLLPNIAWTSDGSNTAGVIKIARGGNKFEDFNVIFEQDLTTETNFQLTEPLMEWTTHHLRLQLSNGLGESQWVEVSFKTLIVLPDAPIILSPTVNHMVPEGENVEVIWSKSDLAKGYALILSTDQEQQDIIFEGTKFAANDTTHTFNELPVGEYYFNVAGSNVGGLGEWSQVRFEVEAVLGVDGFVKESIISQVVYTSTDRITIQLNDTNHKDLKIDLYDMYGRRVLSNSKAIPQLEANLISINRNVFNGIAILVIIHNGHHEYIKLLGN